MEKYPSPEKISEIPDSDYDHLRCCSHGKFSFANLVKLRELAINTVGDSNLIFEHEISSLITVYHSINDEINKMDEEITSLISEMKPHVLSIPGIGPITAAIIISE